MRDCQVITEFTARLLTYFAHQLKLNFLLKISVSTLELDHL